MINPIQHNSASAWSDSGGDEWQEGTTGGIMGGDTSDSTPSISLAIEGAANQTTSVTAGEVAYRTNIVKISANYYRDFSVSLSSMNGYGSELHGKENPTATINGVGTDVAPSNFSNNTWGFATTEDLSEGSERNLAYSSVPEYKDGAKVITAHRYEDESEWDTSKDYKLSFAAKIGGDSPADHYVTQVALSVVGTPGEIISFLEIENMQDMTARHCEGSHEGTTKQLTDVRDSKTYWVTKTKDGNCWMTQNLDYDLPTTLSEATSDVIGTNVATDISRSTPISGWPSSGSSHNAYYDPGNYYYNGPNNTHAQGTDCDATSSLASCNQFSTSGSDQHYHVGNYYSYNSATVRSGDSITSGNATQSICPKGWKLPTSNNSGNGSFAYLLSQYGLSNSISNGNYNIYGAPLYFVYSGFLSSAKLQHAGNTGYYRSSTADTPYADSYPKAYFLSFDNSVDTSTTMWRHIGESVRCVFVVD